PSCDADLAAGSRFCGSCGAPLQNAQIEQPTEEEAIERHAEMLGFWLDLDPKRPPRLNPALLGSILVVFLLTAGAYAVFGENPAEPGVAPARLVPESAVPPNRVTDEGEAVS